MKNIKWRDKGENEDSYWEWTKVDRIGVINGEYFFNNKPIEVTRNEDGDIVEFEFINKMEVNQHD